MSTRTWFITGCSTGFGHAFAAAVLSRGDQAIITARNPETLADLVALSPERVLALSLDITVESEVVSAVGTATQHFGKIDVLVNNAGYGGVGTVEQTPMALARALMETNYFGTLAVIRAVLPDMLRRRSGQIVNIGSVAGQVGFPVLGYYSASKFALAGLTESLAAEVRPLGVKVTLAELGPFATNFTKSMQVNPPAAHYDMAALSREAGNANWGAGDDPRRGARALLAALSADEPPSRIILGTPGVDVAALHDNRRAQERRKWLSISRLPEQ
jgi:NAD(P)-dependent dehydrogenase (short-subunit alcohol dehydrogenase family)